MARERPFIAAYMMASGKYGTLYTGVTSNLWERVLKHKKGAYDGFSKKYGCTGLVWFRPFQSMKEAIQAEKNMKHWVRLWKIRTIEADNPAWRDLASDWYDETTNRWLLEPDNP
jgi:putative endonuclease